MRSSNQSDMAQARIREIRRTADERTRMVTHFRSLIAKLVVAIHTLTCRGEAEFQVFNYVEIDLDTRVYDANGVRLFNTNYFAELWGGKSPFELVPAVDKWTGLRNA
ncbi:MAG: hypothetical protein ACKO3N_10585, partial [Verrucomicrobiota bacterium]